MVRSNGLARRGGRGRGSADLVDVDMNTCKGNGVQVVCFESMALCMFTEGVCFTCNCRYSACSDGKLK